MKGTKEQADKVTTEWVLAQFVDVVESDANWPTKVRALELMGKFLKMFVEQKKVDIDIRQIVSKLDDVGLRQIAGDYELKELEDGSYGVGDLPSNSGTRVGRKAASGKRPGDRRVESEGGSAGGYQVDSGGTG